MHKSKIERILVLAKTYPSPSSKHVETSCVAGINEEGIMRRLYPIPFRAKLFDDLGNKDLMFLMGNIHRFQDQWLIISLIYPPKQTHPTEPFQNSLF